MTPHPLPLIRSETLGLSTAHISPHNHQPRHYMEIADGGSFARVKATQRYSVPPKANGAHRRDESATDNRPSGRGKRGTIRGFSSGARKRMLKAHALINQSLLRPPALFVTLTYPGNHPVDSSATKKHLDRFAKRFMHRYPHGFFIWRFEYQERGGPHFHLLIYNVWYINRDWLANAWYDVVGSGDERHLRAGTQVRRVRTEEAVARYISKYMAKENIPAGVESTGRCWGIKNKAVYKRFVTRRVVRLTPEEFTMLRRIMRRYLLNQTNGRLNLGWLGPTHGLSCFMSSETAWRLYQYVHDFLLQKQSDHTG